MNIFMVPPLHHLFGLRGLEHDFWGRPWSNLGETCWVEPSDWSAFESWGEEVRSVLTSMNLNKISFSHICFYGFSSRDGIGRWTEHKAGVTLGIGLGMADPSILYPGFFRVAHGACQCAHDPWHVISDRRRFKSTQHPHGDGALKLPADCKLNLSFVKLAKRWDSNCFQ